jgi:hypothetical protein
MRYIFSKMLVSVYQRALYSFSRSCENLKTRRCTEKQNDTVLEHRLSPEANSHLALREIFHLLLNPYVDYRFHKNSREYLNLRQINPEVSVLLVCDAASLDIWFPAIQGLEISKAKYPVMQCNSPKIIPTPTQMQKPTHT